MLDFYEKRKMRSLVYSKVSIGILFILSILLLTSVYERFVVEREMNERKERQEEILRELEERAALLGEKVQYLEHERGIEEELRSRFDVVKEGEQVVIIVEEEGEESPDLDALSKPPGGTEEKKSFLEMIKFW